jgi:hypothetical protein
MKKVTSPLSRIFRHPYFKALLVIAVILCIFLTSRVSNNSGSWEGEGVVNIFPVGAEAKNYRVKAYIEVARVPRGLYGSKKLYDINSVSWPNGGSTYFEECQVIPLEDKYNCTDNGFRDWRVEVQKEPDAY